MECFWEKKIKISYVLSVLILLIHYSPFQQYQNVPMILELVAVFLHKIINVVGVPLFFIISGATFYRDYSNEKYKKKLVSRIYSLGIPYVLWNTFNMLYSIVVSRLLPSSLVERNIEINFWNIFKGIFHYEYNGPFWFVFALIVFTFFAPVFDLMLKKKNLAIFIIVILSILCEFNIGLPVPLFHNKKCIVFYLVGAVIGKYYWDKFIQKVSSKKSILCILGMVIAWVWEYAINVWGVYQSPLVDIVILIIYSLAFWNVFDLICDKIPTRPFMNHFFWVYAIHMNLCGGIGKIMYTICPKTPGWAIVVFLSTVIMTLVLIEGLCVFMQKYLPKAYNVLSGQRT